MDMVNDHENMSNMANKTNHPLYLWFRQHVRKIQGKPLLQEKVLREVVDQLQGDENLLAIVLFGSVASGTHTWKSDIDLVFVYEAHEPSSGLINWYVDGIEVQYFFTTIETLVQNQERVPYLLQIFCEANVLFDRHGTIAPVVDQIEGYFSSHPEVQADWIQLKELHQVEKRGPACQQTTILQRWDELEDKYSDGKRLRTFFRTEDFSIPELRA